MTNNNQSGFTAVELLITLFVAAIFLASGYQLYISTIKDGGEIRAQAVASNEAYNYLQQYKTKATTPCTTTPSLAETDIAVANLTAVKVSVEVTCPYAAVATTPITSMSKISVTIKYNNPQRTVNYTTYVTK